MSKLEWLEAIAAIFAIIGSIVGILQYAGTIDFFTPISSFFELTVPMSAFILTSLLLLSLLVVFVMFPDYFYSQPLQGAELLRYRSVRYVVMLCRTPKTSDYIKEKYEFRFRNYKKLKFSDYQVCLQAMEEKGLVQYDTEKKQWLTTKKSINYLTKYAGYGEYLSLKESA